MRPQTLNIFAFLIFLTLKGCNPTLTPCHSQPHFLVYTYVPLMWEPHIQNALLFCFQQRSLPFLPHNLIPYFCSKIIYSCSIPILIQLSVSLLFVFFPLWGYDNLGFHTTMMGCPHPLTISIMMYICKKFSMHQEIPWLWPDKIIQQMSRTCTLLCFI